MKLWKLILVSVVFVIISMVGCGQQATQKQTEKPKEETKEIKKESSDVKSEETKGEKVATGKFEGKSNHKTSGTATIVKTADGYVLELGDDFSFDNAPDPKWAFGKDGFKKETIFSPLKSKKGKQSYEIPAKINPTEFNEIHLWCEKFSIPLGFAKLG